MNNPRNRILIYLVIFLLLTNIAMLLYFTVFDKAAKMSHVDHRGPGVTAFLQNELRFSKTQMTALDSLKKQHRTVIRPLFDNLGKSKDSFYQLLGRPGITEAALETAATTIGTRQAALDLQFFQNFTSIRNLCTEQQLPKFDAVMPNLTSKMMQPWQKNNPGRRKDSTESKN